MSNITPYTNHQLDVEETILCNNSDKN